MAAKPIQTTPSVKGRRREMLETAGKVTYDKETDTLSIILRDGKITDSEEPRPRLILDYDRSGKLVSLELLDASEQVKAPQSVEFALAATKLRGR